ncbi:nitrogenase iron-molybdenum cofactor biosynthesis protein NifN [Roseospira marina]|uniref:Nitrogenase iron-molybdenum cofactor biosynthesis protein NifN n=1 Tax=Roseospira marina TaxID=140057 RepID=A0A5M6IH45_9PROT|nr:nitrogenase iron-molybdenum cofactor biosynthesis protein NifN [Roseospira marina]KAA5607620.1 nitrogenase iron-molybdenum cofactor biosynthesis protein NifN [Roseospira marina]MBB4312181.1 nitrogenase molybdenum-iron protein NifN [Roseospira marina]MBB5085803.1 nitrogenase molybdenum-iron protein NifN [Roseospira marina]
MIPTDSRRVETPRKALTIDPLKVSPPLGAALALLGVERGMPLFHGSQGCTAFALVLLVRHFREAIPLQTTALGEIETILGGTDNLEAAIRTLATKSKPAVLGICPTALTDTRSEDMTADLRQITQRLGDDLGETLLVHAPAPDYVGGLQEGWAAAVRGIVDAAARPRPRRADHVTVLAGAHLTVGDLDLLRDTIEAFGLTCTLLPDLSGSLDGHVPETWSPVSLGGTPRAALDDLCAASAVLAIGEHMRPAATLLGERSGLPVTVLETISGVKGADRLVAELSKIAKRPVPATLRRDRSRLLDSLIDSHFAAIGQRVAIAAEPDMLRALVTLATDLGCRVPVAVTTTKVPGLDALPADRLLVGDLDDLQTATEEAGGCDLVIAPSPAIRAANALHAPLLRVGFPQVDRVGSQHDTFAGYQGSRRVALTIANAITESHAAHHLRPPAHHHHHAQTEAHHDSATPVAPY